ncbi:MAG: hypothetical protein H6626_12505 [Pseudobdellovibrionaceae bacterium]|nr:hypothetical protein [Bdellovibrionales bacterium]USN47002.1 MAG: hypothetical protein H6626_12505 [Pseudobdellovibrionaceae bacterium]
MSETTKSRRKIKNFLIDPKYQLKISAYFLVATVLIFGGLLAMIFMKVNRIRETVLAEPEISYAIQQSVHTTLMSIVWISLVFFVVAAGVVLLYAIIVSHKVAGPVVAIQAYINDLKKGVYDSPRKLRPSDELNPIMESLHELAESLRNSKG